MGTCIPYFLIGCKKDLRRSRPFWTDNYSCWDVLWCPCRKGCSIIHLSQPQSHHLMMLLVILNNEQAMGHFRLFPPAMAYWMSVEINELWIWWLEFHWKNWISWRCCLPNGLIASCLSEDVEWWQWWLRIPATDFSWRPPLWDIWVDWCILRDFLRKVPWPT